MTFIIALVFAGTISFAICQSWLIRQLRNRYSQPVAPWPTDRPLPKAAVLLSLRGNDPFLVNCLRNILSQDYPDFIVQVVIESETYRIRGPKEITMQAYRPFKEVVAHGTTPKATVV